MINKFLQAFIDDKFNNIKGSYLDLGAGNMSDVEGLESQGWICEGVDIRTGVDLNEVFYSTKAPFDIVASNYVLHLLKNKDNIVKTAYKNLKNGGWFFFHVLDKEDLNTKNGIKKKEVKELFERYFDNISIKTINVYDNEPGHNHWHKLIEVTGRK